MKRKLKVWPFLLLLLAIVVFLWFRGKAEPENTDGVVSMSGEGYRSIAEEDGTLYLVENSGNIYTMDWDTGEKTHVISAPGDVSWASAPDLSVLYYVEEKQLYQFDMSTGQTSMLELSGVLDILAVTEDYLLYLCETGDAEAIWYFNRSTMERVCIVSAEELVGDERAPVFSVVAAGDNNTVFAIFQKVSFVEYPDESEYWLEKWDLSTGERLRLTETGKDPVFLEGGTVYGDCLYYRWDNGLWRVSVNGGEPEYLMELLDRGYYASAFLTDDGQILYGCVGMPDYTTVLCSYDVETGDITPFQYLGHCNSIRSILTHGDRFAVWYFNNNAHEIKLGQLPDEDAPTMIRQLKEALPGMMTALGLEEADAEALTVGQGIPLYYVDNADPVMADTWVHPIYMDDTMVALAYPTLRDTVEFTFTVGVDYAEELDAFLRESGAVEIALVEDKDGIYCITDTGEQRLLQSHYTEITGRIGTLTNAECESILRPFFRGKRIGA